MGGIEDLYSCNGSFGCGLYPKYRRYLLAYGAISSVLSKYCVLQVQQDHQFNPYCPLQMDTDL